MKNLSKRILCSMLVTFFFKAQVLAQGTSYLGLQSFNKFNGAEYISGNQPGTVMMKVNLWGAVHRPGIHHIPAKSDIMSLVSYAGGPNSHAILEEVTIKREMGQSRKLIRVDLKELLKGESHYNVELAPNDIIVIPAKQPLVSRDTMAILGIISIVITSALAVSIIDRNGRGY